MFAVVRSLVGAGDQPDRMPLFCVRSSQLRHEKQTLDLADLSARLTPAWEHVDRTCKHMEMRTV